MSLVFASGFLIPQKFRSFEYFRGIGKRYPNALFPRVDVAANVETRANQLAEQIEKAFPAGRIDIVAHSMGWMRGSFCRTIYAALPAGSQRCPLSLLLIAAARWRTSSRSQRRSGRSAWYTISFAIRWRAWASQSAAWQTLPPEPR